jgi:hypothetical protein
MEEKHVQHHRKELLGHETTYCSSLQRIGKAASEGHGCNPLGIGLPA